MLGRHATIFRFTFVKLELLFSTGIKEKIKTVSYPYIE